MAQQASRSASGWHADGRRCQRFGAVLIGLLAIASGAGCGSSEGGTPGSASSRCAMRLESEAQYDLALTGSGSCPGSVRLTLRVATGDPIHPEWYAAGRAPVVVQGKWRLEAAGATRSVVVSNPGAAAVSLVGLEWTAADLGVPADRLLHNGYQSWSYTGVEAIPAVIADAAQGTAPHAGDDENPLAEVSGVSWWYTALAGDDSRGLVAGADGGTVFKTYIAADGNRMRIIQGVTGDAITLRPGENRTLDGLFITLGDVVSGLDAYARHVATLHPPVAPRHQPLGGWGSWNLYYDQVTAALLREEMAWAHDRLVSLGLTDFLLDDGYEPRWGRWQASERFGADLGTLSAEQTALGLTPAVWVAPIYVNVDDPVVTEHPDWFLHTFDGELRIFSQFGGPRFATLDVSHPDARAFVVSQLEALRAVGYRTFKLDFLYAGAIEGVRQQPMTALESYQLWMRAVRDALPEAHLLGCGAPQLPSVGWVDSMRTGPDIAYTMVPAPRYGFYAGQARHTALRSFTDAWWRLDPDVVLLRGDRIQDVDAWSIVVADALAGGNYLLGDGRQAGELRARMALDPEILAMRDGVAARPRDAMKEKDPQLIASPLFDLKGETAVPHVWKKRSADGRRGWLAVFAWRADPYRTDVELPRGTVEIVPPMSAAGGTTTQAIEGRQTIEVPLHAVRLFRW
jgi:hypothetical protein